MKPAQSKKGALVGKYLKYFIAQVILLLACIQYANFASLSKFQNIDNAVNNEKLENEINRRVQKIVAENGCTVTSSESQSDYEYSDWLNKNRYGNIDEEEYGMTDEFATNLILNVSPTEMNKGSRGILEQTMCMENSRFLNWENEYMMNKAQSDEDDALSQEQKMNDLIFRLMFLAMHDHQHRPARKEALFRQNIDQKTKIQLEYFGVGKFDYECRDAKFIATNVPQFGLGVSISKGSADVLLLGMASNRIGLLLNSIDGGGADHMFHRPWTLASCKRRDMQCVFMPMSPCVVTKEDVRKAPLLTDQELEEFRRTNQLDRKYDDEKVILISSSTSSAKDIPNGFREAMAASVSSLFESVQEDKGTKDNDIFSKPIWEMDQQTLEEVKKSILDESADRWRFDHVATFYILRLNLEYQRKMQQELSEIVPDDFRPESAIGIPIRASDKCAGESTCLEFEQYMEIAHEANEKQKAEKKLGFNTVILTSESREMMDAGLKLSQSPNPPFQFLMNEKDPTQGSGYPHDYLKVQASADGIMFSSMLALKMQLLGATTVANCCSNFHKLMQMYNGRGCGATRVNNFQCLDSLENPEHRVCCAWTRSRYCRLKWQEAQGGKNEKE